MEKARLSDNVLVPLAVNTRDERKDSLQADEGYECQDCYSENAVDASLLIVRQLAECGD